MNNKIILPVVLLMFCFQWSYGQTPEKDQKRRQNFRSAIDKFEENRKNGQIGTPDVLFIGSSSFTAYVGFEEDFEDYNVVNLGFGGSQLSDVLYFFDELVMPYDPSHIIVYEGDNDLYGGLTVSEFIADVHAFVRLVNIHKPGTLISFVSPKPSPARKDFTEKYNEAHRALYDYAKETSSVEFIDVSAPMYRLDGKIRTDIWKNDSLHMNRVGYEEIWGPIIQVYLRD